MDDQTIAITRGQRWIRACIGFQKIHSIEHRPLDSLCQKAFHGFIKIRYAMAMIQINENTERTITDVFKFVMYFF